MKLLILLIAISQTCQHQVIYCGIHKKWNVDSAQFAKRAAVQNGDGMQVRYVKDSTGSIVAKIQFVNKRDTGRRK